MRRIARPHFSHRFVARRERSVAPVPGPWTRGARRSARGGPKRIEHGWAPSGPRNEVDRPFRRGKCVMNAG